MGKKKMPSGIPTPGKRGAGKFTPAPQTKRAVRVPPVPRRTGK